VLSLSVSACRPNETVEGQTRDAKIKTEIKSKLASDVGAATLTSIQVNVTNGVVTLAGPVHNQEEKARAESVAKAADGVVSVNNALQITGDSPAASGMTSSAPAPTSTTMTMTTGTTTTSTTTTFEVTPALTPTLPGPQ
ncbi:MAG: BON domain-containing protein, partial [Acidobacteria bacterium]|nr:BON domain-containing protein [Acidobacteriota bacterium]